MNLEDQIILVIYELHLFMSKKINKIIKAGNCNSDHKIELIR